MRKTFNYFALLAWYLPVLIIQIFAGRASVGSLDDWYETLIKPAWNPPNWVFGPVWFLLYILMTISVWLVYSSKASKKEHLWAYIIYFVQLILNGAWSIVFFHYQMVGTALLILVLLIFAISATYLSFRRINKIASYLLIPYLAWCFYAASLNIAIFYLN